LTADSDEDNSSYVVLDTYERLPPSVHNSDVCRMEADSDGTNRHEDNVASEHSSSEDTVPPVPDVDHHSG